MFFTIKFVILRIIKILIILNKLVKQVLNNRMKVKLTKWFKFMDRFINSSIILG